MCSSELRAFWTAVFPWCSRKRCFASVLQAASRKKITRQRRICGQSATQIRTDGLHKVLLLPRDAAKPGLSQPSTFDLTYKACIQALAHTSTALPNRPIREHDEAGKTMPTLSLPPDVVGAIFQFLKPAHVLENAVSNRPRGLGEAPANRNWSGIDQVAAPSIRPCATRCSGRRTFTQRESQTRPC